MFMPVGYIIHYMCLQISLVMKNENVCWFLISQIFLTFFFRKTFFQIILGPLQKLEKYSVEKTIPNNEDYIVPGHKAHSLD